MRKILWLNLLLLFSIVMNAQDFKAGITGGTIFSQIDGDNYAGFNKLGLTFGGYAARQINENWLAQFEIIYSNKGSYKRAHEASADYTIYKASLHYIEVPLFIRFYVKQFSFDGGAAYGVLLSAKEEDQYGEFEGNPFEDHEWSTIIGVNYQISKRIYAGFRWGYSIGRVRKAYEGDYDWQQHPIWGEKFGQYNHTLAFTIHYEMDKLFNN